MANMNDDLDRNEHKHEKLFEQQSIH